MQNVTDDRLVLTEAGEQALAKADSDTGLHITWRGERLLAEAMIPRCRSARNRSNWCSSDQWLVSSMATAGVHTAMPYRRRIAGVDVVSRSARGDLHGRQYASADECHAAMIAHGYGAPYWSRPHYWMDLRLPRRLRRYLAAHPERAGFVIPQVLNDRERAWWHKTRGCYAACPAHIPAEAAARKAVS